MKASFQGGAVFFLCAALAGCAGALTLPQAKTFADRNVTRYCRGQNDCGKLLQIKAQRLNGRWLIDYDSKGRVLTVAVDDDGNTRLDIWNKK